MHDKKNHSVSIKTVAPPRHVKDSDDDTGVIDIPAVAHAIAKVDTMEKQGCLLVLAGVDMGKVIPLKTNETILLGRGTDCLVALGDDGISKHHMSVRYMGDGKIELSDLNSRNGTFVSGIPVTTAFLGHGEKILMGRKTVLKFMLQDDIDVKYQQDMFESSTKDGLTGAYNRKYFDPKVITDLSFARRHHLPFTFIMFDIDHFKKVNDTHGHQAGDAVLSGISKAVQDVMREEDILGRYGGEEFAVIAQFTTPDGAIILGERIRMCVAENSTLALDVKGNPIHVTISVGVATVTASTIIEASKLIAEADANLYKAKAEGRNKTISSVLGSGSKR